MAPPSTPEHRRRKSRSTYRSPPNISTMVRPPTREDIVGGDSHPNQLRTIGICIDDEFDKADSEYTGVDMLEEEEELLAALTSNLNQLARRTSVFIPATPSNKLIIHESHTTIVQTYDIVTPFFPFSSRPKSPILKPPSDSFTIFLDDVPEEFQHPDDPKRTGTKVHFPILPVSGVYTYPEHRQKKSFNRTLSMMFKKVSNPALI